MTAITQNLPWFVKDLGVSIIGEKCYTSIVENLHLDDVECLKYSLSKGLGLGIVVGGSIMKVPQLLLIVSAQSAKGLSLPAYVLETLSYAITLAYSYRNEFPFSTYGENFFLTLQNVIITLLIIYYPKSRLTRQESVASRLALGVVATVATGAALYLVPLPTLAALQLSTIPLSLFSKIPQIRQNHRARSTGQLSAFAVISQIAGCLARLFTTAAEVGDPILSAGFALALLLNIVLGVQMYIYWGKDDREELGRPSAVAEKRPTPLSYSQSEKVEVVIPPQSPARAGSPQIRHPSGRKWARKVD
ncbi:mannose-P-dolichol utilization defect 1 protein [Panus rudis PR-1116 ss-1]|nr:mannose-P-dolichol utilization defect 1 protein [Panus rudis PR-1116 ss-1]